MDPITGPGNNAPLTPAQQAALKKLHDAATQLEGVFVGMLFKAMDETVPDDGIFGKASNADQTWQQMLDEKRADAIAQTGQLGLAKMIENQLRAQVIADPSKVPGVTSAVADPPPLPTALPNPLEEEK